MGKKPIWENPHHMNANICRANDECKRLIDKGLPMDQVNKQHDASIRDQMQPYFDPAGK